jgi:hypothetical protein
MIYESDQYLELPMLSPRLLSSDVSVFSLSSLPVGARRSPAMSPRGRSCVLPHGRVPAWACRLGAGRPVGPGVGGCLRKGRLSGWIFGGDNGSLYYSPKIMT